LDVKKHELTIDIQSVSPNGTVDKKNEAKFDFINLGWKDVIYSEIIDLEETGLEFNNDESYFEIH
jgi:hypothetical protein